MIWLSGILGIAALGFLATAVAGLRTARRALDRAAVLEVLLTDATDRLAEMEDRLAAVQERQHGIAGELDRLNLRQASSDGGKSRHGFDEAIALTRHGADTRELVDACGLSVGEARLIKVLYGRSEETADRNTSSASESH